MNARYSHEHIETWRRDGVAPIHDFFAHDGHIRADGSMIHDMYLYRVKTPAESKYPWDYYRLISTIPGSGAFQPLIESKCPLVKK